MAQPETAAPSTAVAVQIPSMAPVVGKRIVRAEAARASSPRPMTPAPDTAVNVPEASMVRRMKLMFSIARSLSAVVCGGCSSTRIGCSMCTECVPDAFLSSTL